jgi:hypothetical protein
MNTAQRTVMRSVFMAMLAVMALDFGLATVPAYAQRSDRNERWGRGGDSGEEWSEEDMRRFRERMQEMRRAREEMGSEGLGGDRGRGGFGRGRGGGFPGGGFDGERGEGRGFRRGFGEGDGGGRRDSDRNRSEDDDDDEDNNDEDNERGRRRDDRRSERRDDRRNQDAADPAEYARSLMRDRDKNENGTLEGEELRDLRGSAARADADKDGVITLDELVASSSNSGGRNGQGDKPASGTAANKAVAGGGTSPSMASRVFTALASPSGTGSTGSAKAKRTYRFTPPSERAGLPAWIKSRDRNKNGQVEMSEFGRSWSQRTVNDFRRYDLNDDGVVTPKEAAAREDD